MTFQTKVLYYIFRHVHNGIVRRRCIKKICQIEGGEAYSKTVRELYREYYGLKIGYGTYGSVWTNGALRWQNITIGNYCSFAGNVAIYTGNHPTNFFTTHPILYNPSFGARETIETGKPLSIGYDVWVGQNVVILPSCHTIGNGAVIGAGAIVTKDIEPYTINVGNPAKSIKKRFSESTILKLEETRWWEMDKEELIKNAERLQHIVAED